MPDTVRTFVAITIPDQLRVTLGAHLERYAQLAPGFRWVPPGNLHLTLRFLGNLSVARLEAVATCLRGIRVQPFEVGLGGAGTFGRATAVRVVWLHVAIGVPELSALAAGVESACRAAGVEPEERAFNPHLTLARARDRRGDGLPYLPVAQGLPPWTVAGFTLFRSHTGAGGAVYSVLEEFAA